MRGKYTTITSVGRLSMKISWSSYIIKSQYNYNKEIYHEMSNSICKFIIYVITKEYERHAS
jgi:hypothetical protein